MSPRGIRRARLLLVVVVLAWFFSPPAWRYAVPLWLPFVRDRGPQTADVERFGWAGEEPEEDDPAFWSSPPVRRRRAPLLRRVGASLVVVAFVALVAWGISIRRGWSALDHGTQTRIEQALSGQAQRIAGHPVRVRCDTKGR